MQTRFLTVVLLGFVLVGAAACGGGSDDGLSLAEEEALQQEAQAAEMKAEEAEAARKKAEADAARAEEERKAAERKAADQETARQAELEQAREQAAEARRRAEEQQREQAQVLEANHRAQGLLDALEALPDPVALADSPSEAAVSVRTKGTLKFGTTSSTAKSGFRYAKVTDTFGRTRTTVAYTDRELSRKLLDHYGAHLEGTTQIKVSDARIDVTNLVGANSPTSLTSRVPPKKVPTDGYTAPVGLTSVSGKVHGQSGTFRCTGQNCSITLTATYSDHDSNSDTADELTGLTIASDTLVFEPGGASISLCEDVPGSCAFDDGEYMVFGYWIVDPESATGGYSVQPFAQVMEGSSLKAFPTSGTARYTGAAVGVYVEGAPFGSTEIDKRQGDFEAAVSLTATFGGTVSGRINGFRPMPRAGSAAPRTSNWRVTLGEASTGASITGGSATIDGLQSTGGWSAQFVQARSDAASDQPPAVVGVFDTSGQSLHVVGAFGARKQ